MAGTPELLDAHVAAVGHPTPIVRQPALAAHQKSLLNQVSSMHVHNRQIELPQRFAASCNEDIVETLHPIQEGDVRRHEFTIDPDDVGVILLMSGNAESHALCGAWAVPDPRAAPHRSQVTIASMLGSKGLPELVIRQVAPPAPRCGI